MIVINLFGGPGVGKTTIAAGIFHKLKSRGLDCELILEYSKELIWDESYIKLNDQLLVFAEQNHRLFRLKNKVDVVITDSPILLSAIYNKLYAKNFENFVKKVFNSYENRNYLIKRQIPFEQNGRIHSKAESEILDRRIKIILNNYIQVDYKDAIEKIVISYEKELNKRR